MATAIAAIVSGASVFAVRSALGPVDVRRVRVRLARLPRAQHGLTIAQITDLHVGPTIGREIVEDVVNRTNALAPDIIAITGDLVDGSVNELREAIAPLANLRGAARRLLRNRQSRIFLRGGSVAERALAAGYSRAWQ